MLLQTGELHNALTHLRYESRSYRPKNIKAVREVIQSLEGLLERHRGFQEEIIFPFLESHIPRHEAAIHLLETEHEDIRTNKDKLKSSLQKLSKADRNLNDGKIYERGIYLISLVQHHVAFEQRHIRESIHKELHEDETTVITRRVSKWLKKKANRKTVGDSCSSCRTS